ncbi:MAG: HNH/ENDO VII family nuclease [Oscillospiraceae bacterium]
MKRILSLLLVVIFCLTGCGTSTTEEISNVVTTAADITENQEMSTAETEVVSLEESANSIQAQNMNFTSLNDPNLLQYVEDSVYTNVVEGLDSEKYFVENVETVYISKEYLDELSYNSQENVYFGYTLSDITSQWGEEKYIFTVGDDGKTTIQAFKEYDDTYDKVIRNIAIGTGIILVCVTVSVVTGGTGAAPAVSMIFAASAKTGTIMALSSGTLGGAATAITCGIEGKSLDDTIKESALSASEGFMWGAIGGTVTGGASEAIALKGAATSGLTMNQVAAIQKESKYPLDVIKGFKTMEQYNICKDAGLVPCEVNGKVSLIRQIDLNITDEMGRTNLQRMEQGLAALDANGQTYELHHIGQKVDSTLAILTKSEHMQGGNNKIWHELGKNTEVHGAGNNWDAQRKAFWETMAKLLSGGA